MLLQAAAAIAIGLPFPGAVPGRWYVAGPRPLRVEGAIYFASPAEKSFWLVNEKGYTVRQFGLDATAEEIKTWRQSASLPAGFVAPNPLATVRLLPVLSSVQSWLDVAGLGVRLAMPNSQATKPERGTLVLFLSTVGPVDHVYADRLREVGVAAKEAGIAVVGLFPGKDETRAGIASYATRRSLGFPCALDVGNAYADAYRATRTPEAFLLDGQNRVVYAGSVDASTFGGGVPYLANAIAALEQGTRPGVTSSRVFGTPIDR